jgi:predicted nucleic acid binding AN1-type Zn finger protein
MACRPNRMACRPNEMACPPYKMACPPDEIVCPPAENNTLDNQRSVNKQVQPTDPCVLQTCLLLLLRQRHWSTGAYTRSWSMSPPKTTPPKWGGRCDYKKKDGLKCTNRVAMVVGDCRFCGLHFCNKHRLPETHCCTSLAACQRAAVDLNTTRLLAGRCVGVKIPK